MSMSLERIEIEGALTAPRMMASCVADREIEPADASPILTDPGGA
jgi:hypothetical protein